MSANFNAYAEGRDLGLEIAAELAQTRAERLIGQKRRTNQVDRHTSEVLAQLADDIRNLKKYPLTTRE